MLQHLPTRLSHALAFGLAVSGVLMAGNIDAATPQAAAPAAAGGSGMYVVEVLVFRSTGAVGANGEDLAHPAARGLARESTDSDTQRTAASDTVRLGERLPATSLRLNDLKARLNASGSFRTVAHTAWTQTASSWGSRVGLSAEQLGLTEFGITGIVYLERGTYLHLGLDLAYGNSGGTYALSQIRRVKFNERNYFDHPAFGVIAVVSPLGR